jgi:ankyrin repeat protein
MLAQQRMNLDLHTAAREGQHQRVQDLLAAGADMDAVDEAGRTAVHAAAAAGQLAGAQQLLAAGADVHAADEVGSTALHAAAAAGHQEVVQLLLTAGADVGAADEKGRTALYLAAEAGHQKVVQLLLAAGADLNAAGGQTAALSPLVAAVQGGYHGVVQLLLDKGSTTKLSAAALHPLLLLTAHFGHSRTMQLLLEELPVVEPPLPPSVLGLTAKIAALGFPAVEHASTFAWVATELQQRCPKQLQQLLNGGLRTSAAAALAAVLIERASDDL